MEFGFFFLSCFVIVIALFQRELLFEPNTHRIILGISAVIFVVGAVLLFGNLQRNLIAATLLNPLVSIGLFWVVRKLFRWWYERDPKDTFMDWTPGMAADRAFNIIYFTSAFCSCALVPVMAEKLANSIF